MKIAIRADGGNSIGMGHIMRTLVLAKELSKINDVFYICRIDEPLSDTYSIGIEKVKSKGFVVKTIREKHMLSDLKIFKSDLLITDSYDIDEKYFHETKKMFNKTAYIDDMNLYNFNVDFLINQNIDAMDYKYKVNDNTKLFLGSQYTMLRDEFRNLPQKHIKKKVKDIMLTVGGADPYYVTEQILNYVEQLDYNFHVVIGPSFGKNTVLKSYESKKVKLYFNANMYEIMQKCDLAISACGSTLYELAACGTPTLGIILADNQSDIAIKMEKLGIIQNLGWYNKIDQTYLIDCLDKLSQNIKTRENISLKSQELINGNGIEKLVDYINSLA